MNYRSVLPALALVTLARCAGTDDSRNLYEGIRQRGAAVPDLTAAQPAAPQTGL